MGVKVDRHRSEFDIMRENKMREKKEQKRLLELQLKNDAEFLKNHLCIKRDNDVEKKKK